MAALDFPPSPVVGDKYPVTPAPGVPQYTWDGEKWTTTGAQVTSANPSNNLPLINATPAVPGVGTQYSREDHVHPTDTTRAADTVVLKKSPQTLTVTEQTDVRKNLYAAPFDALAYNGMQINGSFEVSQEKGAGGATATTGYVCDGWILQTLGTSVPTANQGANPGLFAGLYNFINIAATTAQASMGAGDFVQVYQVIEGYRIARLAWGTANAQPLTIGFWTAHHRPGTYSVCVRNGVPNRSYAATYTQNAADTAEYKTITIPGDTAGTWNINNTAGIQLSFAMASGTTFAAPVLNAWQAGNYIAGTGQINGIAATSDIFRLSGVVVIPGIEAPSAARSPLIMRPYDQELLTCQRYWQASYASADYPSATGLTALVAGIPVRFAPLLRATPTTAVTSHLAGNVNTVVVADVTTFGCAVQITAAAANRVYWYGQVNADARL